MRFIDAPLGFRDRAPAGGGAESCFFTKRSWWRYAAYLGDEARHFERYRSAYAIVAARLGQQVCWVRMGSIWLEISVADDEAIASEEDGDEYYSIPEEAIQYLPEEWRSELQATIEGNRAVLRSVDKEITRLIKLSASSVNLVTLKYIRDRLQSYRFEATMDVILELEMLVTAFVVTYTRLSQGGAFSGFDRNELPDQFRPFHDDIIELRNQRFAHNDGHHTIQDALEIGFKDDRFELHMSQEIRVQIGGAPEWAKMVDFLDGLYADRMFRLIARLNEKTGKEWTLPTGPDPRDLDDAA